MELNSTEIMIAKDLKIIKGNYIKFDCNERYIYIYIYIIAD